MTPLEDFSLNGYVLRRSQAPLPLIEGIREVVLEEIGRLVPAATSCQDPLWVLRATCDSHLVSRLYDSLRSHPALLSCGRNASISRPVFQFLHQPGLYEKIPLRVDVPFETKELALWHQDFHYVRGKTTDVTAWMPLFDVEIEHGPLAVMPATHRLGILPHDIQIGKKSMPRGIYHREVRIIEMCAGDVLYFNSLLLHSSTINVSHTIRYSVQFRFTEQLAGISNHEEMGGVVSL